LKPLATVWWTTAILCSACSRGTLDLSNNTDREALKIDIQNALTAGNCSQAIDLSKQLYFSSYTDNDVRMLYASSLACNIGIKLYPLISQIGDSDFSNADAIFKSLVRLFPSRTALDSKLQSGWFAQDALQAMLNPGTVIGPIDAINAGTENPGSVLARDRVTDANVYLVFIAMSELGTSLNRYGFNASDDPATLGYAQQVDLPWQTLLDVKADTSGAACGTASAMLNLFDGIEAMIEAAAGSTTDSLSDILTQLESAAETAANTQCSVIDGFSASQCAAAITRLRDRASCGESDPIASTAAGIIQGINFLWQ